MTSLWLCTCQRASSELKEERAENLKDSQVDEATVSFASFKGIPCTKKSRARWNDSTALAYSQRMAQMLVHVKSLDERFRTASARARPLTVKLFRLW